MKSTAVFPIHTINYPLSLLNALNIASKCHGLALRASDTIEKSRQNRGAVVELYSSSRMKFQFHDGRRSADFSSNKKKKKKKRRKKRKKASRVFRIIFYPTIVSIATSNMNLSGRQREEEQFGPTVLFRDNFQPLRHRGSPLSFLSSGNVISIFITRTCHAAFSSLDGRQLYPWHPVRRKVLNYFVRTPDGKFTSRCWPFDRPRKFAAFRLIAPSIEPARCAV